MTFPGRCLADSTSLAAARRDGSFAAAPGIVLKYVCVGRLDEFHVENETYDLIERHNPPPHFIRSFLRLPYAHFMQRPPESLEERLRGNRRVDPETGRCLEGAAAGADRPRRALGRGGCPRRFAWLEGALGVVQGDLRMANLLLDAEEHLKVADFDCRAGTAARTRRATSSAPLAPSCTR
ncbi:protein kinase domain-containing protein [Cordyceps fumosorosea ARSEF 2679]|uniref:Protein kinase domain-containing protein n=1 Tax=Cordyceps fumosorosea (strain ARSEF 2679) TaxID=1081104 RepID=A0A162JIY4_CORFA|nr:protein kinase domain-containing protein [Cordyceps fumosorosea ARSEF 2679]OAA69692.1 protein kinase domain-containing protein [Cordyceps fumosorosea ARSEF 2679]